MRFFCLLFLEEEEKADFRNLLKNRKRNPSDPTKCYIEDLVDVPVNNLSKFTIWAKTEAGDNQMGGGDSFAVKVTGSNGTEFPAEVKDKNTGSYDVTFTPTVSGPMKVSVTLEGTPIAGSPFDSTALRGKWFSVKLISFKANPLWSLAELELLAETSTTVLWNSLLRSLTKTRSLSKVYRSHNFFLTIKVAEDEISVQLKNVANGEDEAVFLSPTDTVGKFSGQFQPSESGEYDLKLDYASGAAVFDKRIKIDGTNSHCISIFLPFLDHPVLKSYSIKGNTNGTVDVPIEFELTQLTQSDDSPLAVSAEDLNLTCTNAGEPVDGKVELKGKNLWNSEKK